MWSAVSGEEMPVNFEEPVISIPIVPNVTSATMVPSRGNHVIASRRPLSNPYVSRPPGRRGGLLAAPASTAAIRKTSATAPQISAPPRNGCGRLGLWRRGLPVRDQPAAGGRERLPRLFGDLGIDDDLIVDNRHAILEQVVAAHLSRFIQPGMTLVLYGPQELAVPPSPALIASAKEIPGGIPAFHSLAAPVDPLPVGQLADRIEIASRSSPKPERSAGLWFRDPAADALPLGNGNHQSGGRVTILAPDDPELKIHEFLVAPGEELRELGLKPAAVEAAPRDDRRTTYLQQ
jgi:hypothetical protein